MTLSITSAEPSDWEQLRSIRLSSLREAPAAFGSSYERELSLTSEDWQERIATAQTYLASNGSGDVIGTATAVWLRNGDMALVGMYVAPGSRGSGCSVALLDAVVDLTRRRGGSRVVLQVNDNNARAVSCYQRYGFTPTGRQHPSERHPGLTEIEYAYRLAVGAGDPGPRG